MIMLSSTGPAADWEAAGTGAMPAGRGVSKSVRGISGTRPDGRQDRGVPSIRSAFDASHLNHAVKKRSEFGHVSSYDKRCKVHAVIAKRTAQVLPALLAVAMQVQAAIIQCVKSAQ